MFPVIAQIGSFTIYSYGFLIALGYISALLLGRYLAKARGLDPSPFMDLAFIAIVCGVIGARLVFVLQNLDQFLQHPAEIVDFWGGGLVFYGGFVLATAACLAYGYWRKMPLRLSADIVVAGVAFGHAFGRLGCFCAGCCYGNACPYPWAVHNNSQFVAAELRGQPIHPVQLYESFSLFLLAGLLTYLIRNRKLADGGPALVYLMGYAAIRFVTEIFRGDADRGFLLGGWLSLSQGIGLALFLLGGGILVGSFRRKNL